MRLTELRVVLPSGDALRLLLDTKIKAHDGLHLAGATLLIIGVILVLTRETTDLGLRRVKPRECPRPVAIAPAPAAAAASARASPRLGDGSAACPSLKLRVAISRMDGLWKDIILVDGAERRVRWIRARGRAVYVALSPLSLLSSLDQRESLACDEQSVLRESELEEMEAESSRRPLMISRA